MQQYAQALPGAVAKELGDARAQELGQALHSAYNVESVAIGLQQVTGAQEKEPYLAEIEEASGKFRALANLVRVA